MTYVPKTFDGTISRHDLQALKRATQVSFHSSWSDGGSDAGTHRICVTQEGEVFNGEREMYLERGLLRNYGDSVRGCEMSAFAMRMCAQSDDNWQTVVACMRAGDVISLRWTRANDSDCLRDAEMSRDTLDVILTRGKRVLTFRVETSVVPVDSLARMVRRSEAMQVNR